MAPSRRVNCQHGLNAADQGLAWAAGTPLDTRLQQGAAVYVGIGLGESYGILKGLFGDRFLARRRQGAILAVPVQRHGEAFGVVEYEREARPSDRFAAGDRSRLAAIASLCAVAVEELQPRPPAAT